MAGSCEHGNNPMGSLQGREFLKDCSMGLVN
jgi:hypothetical protein